MFFRMLTWPFRLLFTAFGLFGPLFAFAFGILPFVIYAWVAVIATKYDVSVLLHHSLPTWAALAIGLIAGSVTILLAIILKILSIAGAITALIAL